MPNVECPDCGAMPMQRHAAGCEVAASARPVWCAAAPGQPYASDPVVINAFELPCANCAAAPGQPHAADCSVRLHVLLARTEKDAREHRIIQRLSRIKHGPGGTGASGPCDADCEKCALEKQLHDVRACPHTATYQCTHARPGRACGGVFCLACNAQLVVPTRGQRRTCPTCQRERIDPHEQVVLTPHAYVAPTGYTWATRWSTSYPTLFGTDPANRVTPPPGSDALRLELFNALTASDLVSHEPDRMWWLLRHDWKARISSELHSLIGFIAVMEHRSYLSDLLAGNAAPIMRPLLALADAFDLMHWLPLSNLHVAYQ